MDSAVYIDGAAAGLGEPDAWKKWHKGNVTAAAATVGIDDSPEQVFREMGRWLRVVDNHVESLSLALETDDILTARQNRSLAVIFAFQSANPIGLNLDLLHAYQALGLRMMGLVYNRQNFVGGGCGDEEDGGLTDFGRDVVKLCDELGILLDLSHVGYRTSLEVTELSRNPVVFSHSNPRAVCDNRRNIPDDLIREVADRGGLIGVTTFPSFVRRDTRPTLEDVLNHVDYVAQLVGIDSVAVGTDYYSGGSPALYAELTRKGFWDSRDIEPCPHIFPEGISDPTEFRAIQVGLVSRGYSEDAISGVMGTNWLRIFKSVWPS